MITHPSLSEQLVEDWYWHSVYTVGRILPLNYLELTEDNQIRLGHHVPPGGEPLEVPGGNPVRLIVLQYTLCTMQDTLKH